MTDTSVPEPFDELAEVEAMIAALPSITRIYPFETIAPEAAHELSCAIPAAKTALADSAETDRKLSELLEADVRIRERLEATQADQSAAIRLEREQLAEQLAKIELPLEIAMEDGERARQTVLTAMVPLWDVVYAATVPAAHARCIEDFHAALAPLLPSVNVRLAIARQSQLFVRLSCYWNHLRPGLAQSLSVTRTTCTELVAVAEEILAGTFSMRVVAVSDEISGDGKMMLRRDAMQARRERKRHEEFAARVSEAAAAETEREAEMQAHEAAAEREESQLETAEAVA